MEELKEYRKPVPEFAIARAIELKRELPQAYFYVDELAGGTYITLDPFMVLGYGGNLYYIDVWNEPKFEGRRTK